MKIYLINGYSKQIGQWEVEIFTDKNKAEKAYNNYVDEYEATRSTDDEWYATCKDDITWMSLEERNISVENDNDDKIFLLTIEQYNKYKDFIPSINICWWLRSPGRNNISAADVESDGSVGYNGGSVDGDGEAVRPALYLESSNLPIGTRIIKYEFPWIVIDKNLAIAEIPIGFEKFDGKSNDYENSYIRKWLKDWIKNRKE